MNGARSMITPNTRLKPRRGIALVVVLMVTVAVAAIASGATFLSLNTSLVSKYHNRLSILETVADAGLEEARSALNSGSGIYPDSGYFVLENGVAVTNATGGTIPGIRRWTYVGPSGITTGQYGVFGSIVTVVTDGSGNRIVRRAEAVQESFAKYAYFTDVEGAIVFGRNDVLYGPVHSNDVIQIQAAAPGATFHGPLRTAQTITNRNWGNYNAGFEENVTPIPFPNTAALTRLETQATLGGTRITSSSAGTMGEATTRIEFVALDLDGNGDSTGVDEGFMKIYQSTTANSAGAQWVVAARPSDYATNGLASSLNCGHTLTTGAAATQHSHFIPFASHGGAASSTTRDNKGYAVNEGQNRFCFLGGSDILNHTTTPAGSFQATDARGSWLPWTGTIDPRVTAARPADAGYLWPINRAGNPNFKGVIYVAGDVAISGKLRGQITLAASGYIVIADNITYVTNPGSTMPCNSNSRDMLGLFAGRSVVMADNTLNSPARPRSSIAHRTWAVNGGNEFVHGVVLALEQFIAERYDQGPLDVEDCEGANNERGCLFLTGGIIQYTRGPVGITNGQGYIKRYQYDACAGVNPPPYFPTTGIFIRGHYYEVEPTNFDIDSYWQLLIPAP